MGPAAVPLGNLVTVPPEATEAIACNQQRGMKGQYPLVAVSFSVFRTKTSLQRVSLSCSLWSKGDGSWSPFPAIFPAHLHSCPLNEGSASGFPQQPVWGTIISSHSLAELPVQRSVSPCRPLVQPWAGALSHGSPRRRSSMSIFLSMDEKINE